MENTAPVGNTKPESSEEPENEAAVSANEPENEAAVSADEPENEANRPAAVPPQPAEAVVANVDKEKRDEDDDADVIVIPREVFNYIVVAVVFFMVGAVVGSLVFAPIRPQNMENIVRTAMVDALGDTQIAAAEPEVQRPDPNTRYDLVIDADDPAWGPEDASVVIVEYSDFTCGFCGRFARETLPQIRENYGDQVRFVYKDLPILSQLSYATALAAECADEQGQFWPYHDVLFENQGQINSVDGLIMIASDLGLDTDAFQTCFDEQIPQDEIRADFESGQAFGQLGTPAFFINGRFVSGAQPYLVFAGIIDEELAAAAEEGA